MGLPRRASAGVATALALAVVTLASSAALADQVRNSEWWLRALHVTQAWQSSQGSGVTVAVLDTGVNPFQADLTGSVLAGKDFTGSTRVPGGQFWGMHGTAVASLIAGHGHGPGNADGIIGVAPAAHILAVRVTLESNDPQLGDATIAAGLPRSIAAGIRYAVASGATVIDLPLDPVTAAGAPGAGGSGAERAAVAYALRHNVVLVAPAGDSGAKANAVNYPAAYPGVISVGAFNSSFIKAPFSSRQRYVTVTAAGQGVTAATAAQGYAKVNSTSGASAIVAGIVALIRAQFPGLPPGQVTKAITKSTVYKGTSSGSGHGTVDAAAALTAAAGIAEAVPAAGSATSPKVTPPSPPAVHATGTSLSRALIKDAGIGGATFLVLLVLILAVGALRRRRARSARLAEVRAASQVRGRAPPEAADPADTTAGFLPAPVSGREAVAGAFPGMSSLASGHGKGSGRGLGQPGSAFPESAFPPGAARDRALAESGVSGFAGAFLGAPTPEGSEGPASYRPAAVSVEVGSGPSGPHRSGGVRTPKAPGSPPWEAAPKPDSDLPWPQPPAAAAGKPPLPAQRRPARDDRGPSIPRRPSWDTVAEEAWPGGPREAAPHPHAPEPDDRSSAATSGRAGLGAPAGNRGGRARPERGQPLYVWTPSSAVEDPGGADRFAAVARTTRGRPPWEIPGAAEAQPGIATGGFAAEAPTTFGDLVSPAPPGEGRGSRLGSTSGPATAAAAAPGAFGAPPDDAGGVFRVPASDPADSFAITSADQSGAFEIPSADTGEMSAIPADNPAGPYPVPLGETAGAFGVLAPSGADPGPGSAHSPDWFPGFTGGGTPFPGSPRTSAGSLTGPPAAWGETFSDAHEISGAAVAPPRHARSAEQAPAAQPPAAQAPEPGAGPDDTDSFRSATADASTETFAAFPKDHHPGRPGRTSRAENTDTFPALSRDPGDDSSEEGF